MPKFRVEKIEIKKQSLELLSQEQLTFFIIAGHVLNELVFAQKLFMACGNTASKLRKRKRKGPKWQAELEANAVQDLIIQRILLGKVYEAKVFLEEYAFKRPWFKKFRRLLSSRGKLVLKKLISAHNYDKKQHNSGLLYIARNKFAFHYHIAPVVQTVCKLENIPEAFILYLTDHIGCALSLGSEEAVTKAFVKMTSLKRTSMQAVLGRTRDLLIHRHRLIQNLLAECMATIAYDGVPHLSIVHRRKQMMFSKRHTIDNYEIPWFFSA